MAASNATCAHNCLAGPIDCAQQALPTIDTAINDGSRQYKKLGTCQPLLPLFLPHTFAGIFIAIMSERQMGDSRPFQANDDGLGAIDQSLKRRSKTIQSYKPSTATASSTSTLGADNATAQNTAELAHEVGPSGGTANGPAANSEVPTAEQLKEIYH